MDDGTLSQKIRHFSTLTSQLQAEFQNSQPAAIDCHRVMIFTKRERISQVVKSLVIAEVVMQPKAWKTRRDSLPRRLLFSQLHSNTCRT